MNDSLVENIRKEMRAVPDFPKAGINFYDITTLLKNAALFGDIIHAFAERYKPLNVDAVVGIEARGFILGAAIAFELKKPFIPIRKPGKLPAKTLSVSYAKEYGEDSVEMHHDALHAKQRVVLIDDLLATGGTARASIDLIQGCGAEVTECGVVAELLFLDGKEKISPTPLFSLIGYTN